MKSDSMKFVKNEGYILLGTLQNQKRLKVKHFLKCDNFAGVNAKNNTYCVLAKVEGEDGAYLLFQPEKEDLYGWRSETSYYVPNEWACVKLDRKGNIVEFLDSFVGFEVYNEILETMPVVILSGVI